MTVTNLYDYRGISPFPQAGEFVVESPGPDYRSLRVGELTDLAIGEAVSAAEVDPLDAKRSARAAGDLGRVGSAVPRLEVVAGQPPTSTAYATGIGERLALMRRGQKAA